MCVPGRGKTIRPTITAKWLHFFELHSVYRDRLLAASHRRSRFWKMHVRAHVPAVKFRPVAHTFEWYDDRSSELAQGVLDRNGLRSRDAPCNQSCGFEIAKSSCQHALGDAPEMAAQLPMSMRPLPKRKQNLGRPPTDKYRRRCFRSLHSVHILSFVLRSGPARTRLSCHKINLRPNVEMVGVTSVSGFRWTR
jgi:hypothetical protein